MVSSNERGPLAALQDHDKQAGLGLDQPNMDYLVEQYTALDRSPVWLTYLCIKAILFANHLIDPLHRTRQKYCIHHLGQLR